MSTRRKWMWPLLTTGLLAMGCGGNETATQTVAAATPTSRPAQTVDNGVRMVPVMGGKYHVWTQRIGSGAVKVLLLHGGPGASHDYLVNFADHLPQAGYELYFYDQLGSWHSDQPDDPSLWTVDRFREEVEEVRRDLGLDDFVLVGHSWGGMLAIEYALKYQQHLRGLVISDMVASIPRYVAGVNRLLQEMPADQRAILEKYEAGGDYDNPEYQEVLFGQLYAQHICRLDPWPKPLQDAFDHLNTQVYNTMQGPSEFTVTGNFKDWDRMDDLAKITVPTLLIVGRYDTMQVPDIEEMNRRLSDSRMVVCENGSHMCNWDDEDAYFSGLLKFLGELRR